MANVQRVGAKLFCRDGADLPLVDVIPVFHRWIQSDAVPGLLIDVADYSHVPEGPGVILVSHEGIYALDELGGRRGLAYTARFPAFETLRDCLRWSLRAAVIAACALEAEFSGRLYFRGDEIEVFVNDRLNAPNDALGAAILDQEIDRLLREIYPDLPCERRIDPDPRQRLSVLVRAGRQMSLTDLATRVVG